MAIDILQEFYMEGKIKKQVTGFITKDGAEVIAMQGDSTLKWIALILYV